MIPAGGAGSRLGRATPKQFLRLGADAVLVATTRHFLRHPGVALVVVAAPPALVARTERLLRRLTPAPPRAMRSAGSPATPLRGRRPPPVIRVVSGGRERQDSVECALQAVPADIAVVVVHDAVRPFVTPSLITRVIRAASEGGAAICGLPITETVKRVREATVEATIDRTGLWAVQTPQAFRAELLREAHDKARRDGVVGTDDAMLVERLGHPVRVVPGIPDNLKITTREDLRRARGRLTR